MSVVLKSSHLRQWRKKISLEIPEMLKKLKRLRRAVGKSIILKYLFEGTKNGYILIFTFKP